MRKRSDESLAGFLGSRETAADFEHVVRVADEVGGDVDRLWTQLADGADLLWLAGSAGVDPPTVARVALDALSLAEGEVEELCAEVHDVLTAARARLDGHGSADDLERAGTNAYCRIAFPRDDPLADDADVVTDAAVYAAQAAEWAARPGQGPATANPTDAAMVLHHLAMLGPVQRGLDGRDPAWKAGISIEAARWARFVRTRIASSEVSAAFRRTVARP